MGGWRGVRKYDLSTSTVFQLWPTAMGGARLPQSIIVHSIGINLHMMPQKERSNENGGRMLSREKQLSMHVRTELTTSETQSVYIDIYLPSLVG